ncbi:MAG: hypothetical protein KBT68_06670 [bacterium]|nr:hypothetical protein [Candidatus Colisoma equi]
MQPRREAGVAFSLPCRRTGQSVHHICVTNAAKLTRNERTIQRYVNYGVLSAKLFPVILTDRGTEFSNPSRIEFDKDGKRRTRVFFCDPMNSNQKSHLLRPKRDVRHG